MSGVSLPVTRPSGRALVVAGAGGRAEALATLQRIGYGCGEADDPYAAMAELSRRPLVYRAVILSLASLHREELAVIATLKRRLPHVEIWLTHTDGRQSALAEAMRLGADGLLSAEGLHRIAVPAAGVMAYPPTPVADEPPALAPATVAAPPRVESPVRNAAPSPSSNPVAEAPEEEANTIGEPVLSPEELRALLQEQPLPPPVGSGE